VGGSFQGPPRGLHVSTPTHKGTNHPIQANSNNYHKWANNTRRWASGYHFRKVGQTTKKTSKMDQNIRVMDGWLSTSLKAGGG